MSGLTAVDFDWAPDRSALAIASDGEIWIYSVTSDEQYPVGPVSDVQSVAWSPDGADIAITRPGSGSPNQQDLWVMRTDGSGAAVVASDSRGIAGPRWSPDGERIAYTRLCEVRATLQFPCREEQEVVLVSVDVHDPFRPSGAQAVVPHPETVDADGLSTWWYSVSVTWSPNGTTLLYIGWPEADPDDPPVSCWEASSPCRWTATRHHSCSTKHRNSRRTGRRHRGHRTAGADNRSADRTRPPTPTRTHDQHTSTTRRAGPGHLPSHDRSTDERPP